MRGVARNYRRGPIIGLVACALVALAWPQHARADIKPIPLSSTAVAAGAQITYDKGIEFVTIGSVNNAAWPGNGTSGDRAIGRGSVGYEYKIGRFEVTTSQWVDFFNAAYDRPSTEWLPHLSPPGHWGAVSVTPNTATGRRWAVPAGNEMIPVGNISWRMAAIYCNWLHNDQSSDRNAFLNGAYDVGTFGYTGDVFTDQLTHKPDARYWIPTWDEWLKAAHFDPNKPGAGQGGSGVAQWNYYSTNSDHAPVYGPPGVFAGLASQANAGWDGFDFPGKNPFSVPLGAYLETQSPWGLLDTAGGTTEWTEEVLLVNKRFPVYRGLVGSAWVLGAGFSPDWIGVGGGESPSINTFDFGFRIAGSIPSPGALPLALCGTLGYLRRTRKGGPHAHVQSGSRSRLGRREHIAGTGAAD